MARQTPAPEVSLETLEVALKIHRREFSKIKKMTDAQFDAFRTNFSIGSIPVSRGEAISLLGSMIALNLAMQHVLGKR